VDVQCDFHGCVINVSRNFVFMLRVGILQHGVLKLEPVATVGGLLNALVHEQRHRFRALRLNR